MPKVMLSSPFVVAMKSAVDGESYLCSEIITVPLTLLQFWHIPRSFIDVHPHQ